MASTKAFNTLMQQFLDELVLVFHNEPVLKLFSSQFPLLCEANPRKPLEVFVSTYGAHTAKIQAKDVSLMDDVPMLFDKIDIRSLWQTCNQTTRDAIWNYLQHLSFMATTVSIIPPEMLSAIETVAMDVASKCETGQMDPSQLLSMLPQLMQNMALPK